MIMKNIVTIIESTFPLNNACEWDFTGWQIKAKDKKKQIKKILICLDITNDTLIQAIKSEVDLIICHHPLLFAKDINDNTISLWKKKLYNKIIITDINVYVLHTNFDSNVRGMNILMAKELNIQNPSFQNNEKLVVIGNFEKKMTIKTIISQVKTYFNIKHVQFIGNKTAIFSKIALAAGSANKVIETLPADVKLLITGEMKWNNIIESIDNDINIILVGHFMEQKFVDFMFNFFTKKIGIEIEIIKYELNNPIIIF